MHQFVFAGVSMLFVILAYLAFTVAIELLTYYYIYLPSSAWICDHLFW